ncbi:Oxysterol-binding protein [Ramicandelaber brevisporus]|nr:Oxysterol-binding protein [Ramicandelaber brevisporus]
MSSSEVKSLASLGVPDVFSSTSSSDVSEEALGDESKSIVLSMIKQFSNNMDLSRVTFPTFVLEPRSFIERVTDFMTHPDLLIAASKVDDPLMRFVSVAKYYLSGWHIRPVGVKKPYNPVLGEFFRCKWQFDDGSHAYYIAEQVSHHPPVSAYYYTCPEHRVSIEGDLRPKSRFQFNSVMTYLQGGATITFEARDNEEYQISYPNMYARGVLVGTMLLELGEHAFITCEKTGYRLDVTFHAKPIFGGKYNEISGKIKKIATNETVAELSGTWSDHMNIDRMAATIYPTGKNVLFDAKSATMMPKIVLPLEHQEKYESRRLWQHVTKGIQSRDLDLATSAKTKIEEAQRAALRVRESESVTWKPRFFDVIKNDDGWRCKFLANYKPAEGAEPAKEAEHKIAAVEKFMFDETPSYPTPHGMDQPLE